MNQKSASLLMLHEVVMMNHDPKVTGVVCGIDLMARKVKINWERYCPRWYRYNEMDNIQKFQPEEVKP